MTVLIVILLLVIACSLSESFMELLIWSVGLVFSLGCLCAVIFMVALLVDVVV